MKGSIWLVKLFGLHLIGLLELLYLKIIYTELAVPFRRACGFL